MDDPSQTPQPGAGPTPTPPPAPEPAAAPAAAAPAAAAAPSAASSAAAAVAARPTGITILAILAGLNGLGSLLAGFGAFALGSILFGLSGAIFGLAWLAFAGLWLACGIGFWQLKPWAWPLGVVLAAAGIIWAILGLLGGSGIFSTAISVVIGGVILYYLNQPGIKSLFGRA